MSAKGHEKEHAQKDGAKTPKEEEIEKLRAVADEYKETLQRLQAEWENFRKRSEREQHEFRKFANVSLLGDFLPLVDTVSEALKASQKNSGGEAIEALKKVEGQLVSVLEKNGVRKIESVGKKFDHEMHECIMTGKDDSKDEDLVLEEFARGYTYNGKLLRPAKVRVNKKEQ